MTRKHVCPLLLTAAIDEACGGERLPFATPKAPTGACPIDE
jgi:hypothetical protein